MGYDLHITRQENWYDENSGKRISLIEWKVFLEGDTEMRLDNFAEVTTTSGETIRIESEGLSVWTKYSGNGIEGNFAWFDYREGNIVCKNPDNEIIKKMLSIASQLNAKVQGDDGELYEESAGKVRIVKAGAQKPWWKFW